MLLINAGQSEAFSVIGGSNLLDNTFGSQLETWLGEGSLKFTNVFSHNNNPTTNIYDARNASTFHSTVDEETQGVRATVRPGKVA